MDGSGWRPGGGLVGVSRRRWNGREQGLPGRGPISWEEMGERTPEAVSYTHLQGLSHPAQRPPQHRQPVADALGAAAVVTSQRLPLGAGGLAVQPPGVQGGGDVPGPPEGLLEGGGDFVAPHQVAHRLVGAGGGGDSVAGAVDVHQLAGLGQGVDAGEVDLGLGGLGQGLRAGLLPVPVDRAALGQGLIQAQVPQGHAAAHADGFAGKPRHQRLLGRLGRGEPLDGEAGGLQGLL